MEPKSIGSSRTEKRQNSLLKSLVLRLFLNLLVVAPNAYFSGTLSYPKVIPNPESIRYDLSVLDLVFPREQ